MEFLIAFYEKWIETPRWQKWLLILCIGFLFFALLYYSRIVPLQEDLVNHKKRLDSLVLTVNKLKTIEKRKDKVQRAISELEKKIEKIERQLPTGKEEVAKIIRSIQKADSGVLVLAIKRKNPQKKKYYIEYPYEIFLLSKYPDFITWCEKLSSADRIITFGDINILSSEYFLKEKGSSKSKSPLVLLFKEYKPPFKSDAVLKTFNPKRKNKAYLHDLVKSYSVLIKLDIKAFTLR